MSMKLEDLGPASQAECRMAIRLGYHPIPDKRRGRGWYKFINGVRTVWQINSVDNNKIMWQTADMFLGQYQDHEKFDTLAEALHRPIKESSDGVSGQ